MYACVMCKSDDDGNNAVEGQNSYFFRLILKCCNNMSSIMGYIKMDIKIIKNISYFERLFTY